MGFGGWRSDPATKRPGGAKALLLGTGLWHAWFFSLVARRPH